MGRVAGSYGVRGALKVVPDDGAAAELTGVHEWWVSGHPYGVSGARMHGRAVIGKLAGIETREQALALKGSVIAVRRELLPDPGPGRYYIADLLGLEVINEQGEVLGEVRRTYATGVHDVIEVAGDRTRLIPWVPAIVKDVNLPERRVLVDWGADW